MKIRTITILIVSTSAVAIVAWGLLAQREQTREREIGAKHQTRLASQAKDWARDDLARKEAARENVLNRRRQHLKELEAAWGRPTETPFKNPALNLRQMLEQTARACMPPGAVATVRVDRFTEFDASFELRRPVERRALADISICLLRHGASYLRSLRFIQGGGLLAELDERAIDSVADWTRVSAAEVEKLLIVPEPTPASAVNSGIAPDGRSTDNAATELTGDRKRMRDAQQEFNRRVQEKIKLLNGLVDAQSRAALLGNVQFKADLQARLTLLNEDDATQAGLRTFLLNQGQEYRRTLEELKLDPLYVRVVMREIDEREKQEQPYLTELFAALTERQHSVKGLLATMESQWGNWNANPAASSIRFTSLNTRDQYSQCSSRLENSTTRLDAAIRAWSGWKAN